MVVIIALILSIILQILAFIIALRLIRVSRRKLAWILFAIAFLFLAIRRSFELVSWLKGEHSTEIFANISYFIGIVISILIAISVIILSRVLHSLKRTEEFRKAAEQRFRTLFNSTTDFIIVVDFDGNFIEVNQNTCKILGCTKTELLTKRFNDILTSKYFDILKSKLGNLSETGRYIFEAEYFTKDGRVIPVEINARFLRLGSEQYIICIARDITERKEVRKKILKTVIETEEKERRRFAKDLHDGLGPLLSTIKLYINEIESEEADEQEKKDYIKYTSELIDEAVSSTRTISNNITPNIISNYGLVRSLESFCNKINKTQQISVNFKTIQIEEKFDETIELILYRIITELINNTLKHASAKNIDVILELLNRKLILIYRDDGVGYSLEKVLNEDSGGMGLKNIISRINSINGSFSFNESINKGSELKIRIDVERQATTSQA